jgi:hypothetical protein
VINLGRALRYPFSGPASLSYILIGTLMMALVLPSFLITLLVLLGYQVRIVRDVMAGEDDEMPGWEQIGQNIVRGLVVFAGTLLYYAPAFILTGLGASLIYQLFAGFSLFDLLFNVEARLDLDRDKLALAGLTFALALLWLILSAPLVMASIARYAETGRFEAFTGILTRADEVWDARGAAGSLMFNLFLLTMLMQFVNLAVGSVVCFLPLFINFIHFAAASHLNGQWGAILQRSRPKPSVIRPLTPRR